MKYYDSALQVRLGAALVEAVVGVGHEGLVIPSRYWV
jgi:hypothetical protein